MVNGESEVHVLRLRRGVGHRHIEILTRIGYVEQCLRRKYLLNRCYGNYHFLGKANGGAQNGQDSQEEYSNLAHNLYVWMIAGDSLLFIFLLALYLQQTEGVTVVQGTGDVGTIEIGVYLGYVDIAILIETG